VSRIFINYRRGDTKITASRVYEWLCERYGEDMVFMDVDAIEPGRDWRDAIESAVGSVDLVLALIGRDWLTELQRRKDDPEDYMRSELEAALQRDKRIIPVLVEGAVMPQSDELPPSVAPLTRRQAFEMREERFRFDKEELLRRVDRVLEIARSAETPAAERPAVTEQPPPPVQEQPIWPPPQPIQPPVQPARPPGPQVTVPDSDAAVAAELAKWNWGAFLLTFIWGIRHGVFRSLLTLVPIYGIYEWIMLGKNGNRLAWEQGHWDSVASFRSAQRKWALWGAIVDVLLVIIVAASSGSGGS
jgi:TIR domain